MTNIITIEGPVEIYVQNVPGFDMLDYDHATREERVEAFRAACVALGDDMSDIVIVESFRDMIARRHRTGNATTS